MRNLRSGITCLLAALLVFFIAGCGQETITLPVVVSVTPAPGATGVAIGTNVTATFNMAMNSASITAAGTFTVSGPGGAVSGSVTYSGSTATFTPAAALAYGTTYTATITTAASSPGGAELIGPYSWSFTTVAASVPSVTSVTPLPFASNVAVDATISATFNMPMTAATTDAAFTVTGPGGAIVPGSASLSGSVATFTPSGGPLANGTTYTATITTEATSLSEGIPLAGDYVWTFTTIAPPPLVVFTVPGLGATGVPIGQVLTARFNEAMLCSTLQQSSPATTFTLAGPGAANVPGSATCSGNVATFTPGTALQYNTEYTATISTAAENFAGTPMAVQYQWIFYTVPAPPTPPAVIATVPTDSAPGVPAINVPINQQLTATFSEAMDPATINSATFTLVQTSVPGTPINGVITYTQSGDVATFVPNAPLLPSTNYTAQITSGAMDLNDDAGVTTYTWTFTTAALTLTAAPTVVSTIPVTPNLPSVPEDVTVPLNQAISADFSEPMSPATITATAPPTFTLTYVAAGPIITPVAGLVAYAAIGNELVFLPSAPLLPDTTYTATITTAAEDLDGTPLASNYTWIFKTGTAVTSVGPEVVLTVPAENATDVALNQAVSATFSEAMNPLTLTSSTFQLYPGTAATGTPVPATITYDPVNFIATLTPTNPLAPSAYYTAIVTSGATDLAGNPLGSTPTSPYTNPWTFQTGTESITPPVVLGPTILPFGGFAGGAGMTNTGTYTVINGDSGTTATDYTSYTGFHDDSVPLIVGGFEACSYTETGSDIGLVTGTIYSPLISTSTFCPLEGTAATIAVATEAYSEAQTAYLTLQSNTAPGPGTGSAAQGTTLANTELGGTTIYPGVYYSASSVTIENGPLYLDAQGDPNAYFVFQIGSTLTVGLPGTPVSIILENGAKASNIFWAVGSDVYLNPSGGGTFEGTILAYDFIHVSTVGNAAITTVDGRLISLTASTTLVNTVINVPPAP